MTTTVVRDSMVGDEWIKRSCEANPIGPVLDPTTGQPSSNFLTGPVRLAFVDNLIIPKIKELANGSKLESYEGVLLFTPFADFTPLYNEFYRVCAEKFKQYHDPSSGQYPGIRSPFRDQAEKAARFSGYTPGCVFMSVSSQFKPVVVDQNMNPIVDASKVHAGAWVIASINAYEYGLKPSPATGQVPPNKGVSFGLQSVMLIADDTNLGGGAVDPQSQFGGVNVTPPAAQPNALFGQPAPGAPGTPAAGPPGAPPAPPGVPGAPPAPGMMPATPAPAPAADDVSDLI